MWKIHASIYLNIFLTKSAMNNDDDILQIGASCDMCSKIIIWSGFHHLMK